MTVKVSIFLCGVVGAALAMASTSVHLFWILSADVLFSMMTPQVICVLFLSQRVNHYGACAGFAVGMLLRGLVGEPSIGLPDLLPLPWDKMQADGHRLRLFPFCTAIMLVTTGTILVVSPLATWLSGKRPHRVDRSNGHYLEGIRKDVEESDGLNKERSKEG